MINHRDRERIHTNNTGNLPMEFRTLKYRNREDDYGDPRRNFLVKALTMGLFAAGGRALWPAEALALGFRPRQLPPGQSVYRVRGEVRVDGTAADEETRIRPSSSIETGSNSELVFVVGKDAFMLRENSRVELASLPLALASADENVNGNSLADALIGNLRLLTGKILTVFGERGGDEPLSLRTTTATIGVRGTGVYLESEADRSYVCTCYGETLLTAIDDPASREEITSEHHDAPRFIHGEGRKGGRIEQAPVFNHTDMELLLLEELVGRKPPFKVSRTGSDY